MESEAIGFKLPESSPADSEAEAPDPIGTDKTPCHPYRQHASLQNRNLKRRKRKNALCEWPFSNNTS